MRFPAALLVLLLASAACGGAPTPPQAPAPPVSAPSTSSTKGAIIPAGEAKLGDRTKCPVSGQEFVVTQESPHADYQGKTYYFCCGDCNQEFQKNPEKFLHKSNAGAT